MSSCRSCDAPVVWVETEAKGDKPAKRMPVDADPDNTSRCLVVSDGNLAIVGQAGSGVPIVRYVAKGSGRYRSHFATCPNSKSHRKS